MSQITDESVLELKRNIQEFKTAPDLYIRW